MAEYVSQFITPISEVLDHDHGRAAGTGNYLQIAGECYLLTNDHVACKMAQGGIAHLPQRDQAYHRLIQPAMGFAFPIDVGITHVSSETWRGATQRALPVDQLDERFNPAAGELMFVCGYPGFARRGITEEEIRYPRETQFGMLTIPAVPILTTAVNDPHHQPAIYDPNAHFLVRYEGVAHRPGEGVRETPDARGFSGSLVWDTKFFAVGDEDWTPDMARVCGIVHRWNDELGVLMATRIEVVRETILSAIRHEAAYLNWISRGRPYWDSLPDWLKAEHDIPRLVP